MFMYIIEQHRRTALTHGFQAAFRPRVLRVLALLAVLFENVHLVAQMRREAWSLARGEADLGSRYPVPSAVMGAVMGC